ncbi:MAG: hypothetical protein AAFW88_02130 [Pseudomonadota bacterium]
MSNTVGHADENASGVGELSRAISVAWAKHAKKAATQPYLMALMIGSLLLSIASFFTTYSGMLNFMPVWVISFCITFAVQALLFVTSWRIGFSMADRERAPWFSIFVFAICFSTSVFFSWVALFETINDEELQERTRITRIHRAVEDTVSELQTKALERRRESVETLLGTDVYNQWRGNVNAVADRAGQARGVLEAALQEQARRLAREIAALEQRKAAILADKAAAGERVESDTRSLQRLEDQRPRLVEKVSRLQGEFDIANELVVVQEGRMESEATGGGDGRPAGRGPKWRELRDERNRLKADADTKARLLASAENELGDADARVEALKSAIAAGGSGAGALEIASLDQEIARLAAQQTGGGADGAAVSLDTEVERLRGNLNEFATRFELEPFNAAAQKCAELLEAMRAQPALRGSLGDLSCDRAAMAEFMNPIGVAVSDLRALEAQCVPGGAQAQNVTAMNFEQAVEYGRACIGISGLPAPAVSSLRGEIDRLVLEEDPNASQFVKTVNAFTGGEKLSYFALFIAAAIDVLVLFSGLIGALSTTNSISRHLRPQSDRQREENVSRALGLSLEPHPSDPPHVGRARATLHHAHPFGPQEVMLEGATFVVDSYIDLSEIHDAGEQKAAKDLINSIMSDGMAATDPEEPSRYYIRKGFLSFLREQVFEHDEALELRGELPRTRLKQISGPPRRPALPSPGAFRSGPISVPGPAPTGRSPLDRIAEEMRARNVEREAAGGLRPIDPSAVAETAAMARANAADRAMCRPAEEQPRPGDLADSLKAVQERGAPVGAAEHASTDRPPLGPANAKDRLQKADSIDEAQVREFELAMMEATRKRIEKED